MSLDSYVTVPDYDELSRRYHGKDADELSASQQEVLGRALRAAVDYVENNWPHKAGTTEAAQAILLVGKRLIKRNDSPDGISNWNEEGPVRISYKDPDVLALLGPMARRLVYR
jgi:hypothetical protein